MLSERYDMNDTGTIVSEFRELLGDLRAIYADTGFHIDKRDYQYLAEGKKLRGMFNILDKHLFEMMDELDELFHEHSQGVERAKDFVIFWIYRSGHAGYVAP